jgi:DNA-binding protein HU-beta
MNKPELISSIATKTGLKKKEASMMLDSFTDIVTNSLKKGDKVALIGFGTFGARKRSARNGVNPRTRKKIKIAAKTVPFFKPGKKLKDAVAKKK